MAIIKCPECKHDVSDRAKTCPHCGVEIAGQIITCPDCGEVIFKDVPECPNCNCPINGAGLAYEPAPVAPTKTVKRPDEPQPVAPAPSAKPSKRKVGMGYTVLLVSVVIALIVVLLGLYFYQTTQQQNELRAYENAVTSGEPAVLQNFLDMYAEAPQAHRDTIQARLDELKKIDLEWDNALSVRSKQALERYVQRHPGNVHVTEARLLIDSLDWLTATTENTAESYQLYMDEHVNGNHIDEARDQFAKLDALRLKQEDRDMLRQLFHSFFDALSQKEEGMLGALLAESLSSFMAKEHATVADAVQYMHSLYAPADISNIHFTMLDNWKIMKQPTDDAGQFCYIVSFGVEERIDRSNQELERFASYKASARVNPSGKISAFAMQKIVQ